MPSKMREDGAELREEEVEVEASMEGEVAAPAHWLRTMPCWALSALLHLILIVFLLCVVTEQKTKKEVEATTTVTVASRPKTPPKDPYDPLKKRDTKRQKAVPGKKTKTEVPLVVKKEVPDDQVAVDVPLGTSFENITNVQIADPNSGVSKGINTGIGLGGGAAGAYGARWGKGTLKDEGGSDATEDVVYAALQWLMRHQSADGSWKSADYTQMCKKTCQNVDTSRYGDGRGFADHDVGVTALAMLAFTGYGQTHQAGDYDELVECLRKAVGYLKKVQVQSSDPSTNGRYGPEAGEQWIYDHAIATMAMGELLVMSNDKIGLQQSVTDAVKLCLRAQNDGFGWRYGIKPGDNDTSVTGWMVLALKTAKNARLDVPEAEFTRAFAGALNWFNRATATNGKCGYMVPGDEGSRLAKVHPEPYPFSKEVSCMTAVSVLCRLFAGEQRKARTIQQGIDILMRELPRWQEQKGRALSSINLYYWYYGSYALFQFGGANWKKWNEAMQEALLKSQRQGVICEDGSWDPIDEWGPAGGRVYSTALGAMTFEVYYRFRRIQSALAKETPAKQDEIPTK